MEFHETFPTWDNKFSGEYLNGRTKFLLKSLPSGHNGYSSSFAAAPYSNSPLENESDYCFNISSGLGQILATTKDVELRKFIWEVTHCFLLIISIIYNTILTYEMWLSCRQKIIIFFQEWRNNVGRKTKPLYQRYVELANAKSRLNGFKDAGDELRSRYVIILKQQLRI